MSDPTRLSETEIEDLIRGLPSRQPSAGLRSRVLAHAPTPARRWALLRPAIALGALVVLVLVDVVALGRQERGLAGSLPTTRAAAVAEQSSGDDSLSDIETAGAAHLFARLHANDGDSETYLQLRSRLLENGEGG